MGALSLTYAHISAHSTHAKAPKSLLGAQIRTLNHEWTQIRRRLAWAEIFGKALA